MQNTHKYYPQRIPNPTNLNNTHLEKLPTILLALPRTKKVYQKKYLNKIFIYNIITITQIQSPTTQHILYPLEFKNKFKAIPKLIKEILQQANILFPPQPPPLTLFRPIAVLCGTDNILQNIPHN